MIQVRKTADFRTAFELANTLEKRLSEAFLILNVRQSERTTAEEVRMTQMELEQQLGGLFSLLTVEFLIPYLNRKMLDLTKSKQIPTLPKGLVHPTIVAGINALGRGQDRESLIQFVTTIAQTMGPEALQRYINPDEAIKRLAAAQGLTFSTLSKAWSKSRTRSKKLCSNRCKHPWFSKLVSLLPLLLWIRRRTLRLSTVSQLLCKAWLDSNPKNNNPPLNYLASTYGY